MPRTRTRALLLAVVAGAVTLSVLPAPAQAARTVRAASRPAALAAPDQVLGLAVAGAPTDLSEIEAIEARTGVDVDQVTFYRAWSLRGDFPVADADRVVAAGAVPELVWEPWDPAAGPAQPDYSLDRIVAGDYDTYLTRWARQVRAWGQPLVIRFAHEANGDWYPWSAGVNGNTAADYRAAWRKVVSVFDKQRATNVTWLFTANVPYPGSKPLENLYPGDGVVDRVGLDGYNWGTTQSWSTWQSFGDVFGPGVAELDALSTKPIHVTETGAPEWAGGDKAAWITDMWAWLDTHPEVSGLTWFSLAKEADWRVDSSEASLSAYAAGALGF
ncbi:hypothetical protein GCM10009623_02990 [Nocardioides aestuarii]|uniref:Glycoside hydrolase family 26 protein n=1 Tax=Nocardioides aestuarii TaxID=252231 RepID=A0ABW4TK17_9ACTN